MKYTLYNNGRIDCDHEKCAEWHNHGHQMDELLPEDTLQSSSGIRLCLTCGKGVRLGNADHTFCRGKLASRVAMRFGMVDGEHHKQWVIDQMLLAILGVEEYLKWVGMMSIDPDYAPWDRGIAP